MNRTYEAIRSIHVRFPFDSRSIPVRFDLKTFDYVWGRNEAALLTKKINILF